MKTMSKASLKITVEYAGQKPEVIEGVESFETPGGNLLLLTFLDGSIRGIREFLEFIAEVETK